MKSAFSTRGPQIKIIDAALAEWEQAILQGEKYPKIKALLHVILSCSWWLKLKTGKSSNTTESRRQAITKLRREAQTALGILDPAGASYAGKQDKAIQSGLVVGSKNGNKLGLSGTQAISLYGNYGLERQQYLGNDKRFAIAAGAMRERFQLINKNWDSVSLNDFCEEFNKLPMKNKELSLVDYLKRSERLKFLVMVHGNQFLKPDNTPYKTLNERIGFDQKRRSDMWAMDQSGNLFVSHTDGVNSGNYFNHSSFLSGNDVICAGMIVIHQGELAYINNSSGHYHPDRYALQNALRILSEELDLSGVRVDVMNGNAMQKYKAETFLHNPNSQPDWPANWNALNSLTADM